jgi:sortase A
MANLENMQNRLSTILLLTGSTVLVWCASVWTGIALFERWEARRWNAAPRPKTTASNPPPVSPALKPHQVFGWLDIPRLHISTAVVEGDDTRDLFYGAGHIPGTSLPGTTGNIGIAAHRDTIFRALRGIRKQDTIRIRTASGEHDYSVEATRVVQPSNVEVLNDSGYAELTLVTCYPFWYVGPAPMRFVVQARQMD